MNKLPTAKRAQILRLLCEGTSPRSTSRIADCFINTVTKLLVDAGTACRGYQDATLRNLSCKRLQLDEIWAFCKMKEKNVPTEKKGLRGFGDVYTWTALCADTKLMVSWLVGARNSEYAETFVDDFASCLSNRVQLTTNGHHAYLYAVEVAFDDKVDYSMLVKLYGSAPEAEKGYSPAQCIGTKRRKVMGNPDPAHMPTYYMERSNLTVRMMNRRFTRLTNAFSKKLENHEHAFSLFSIHYNFARVHKTVRVTPAMEAGVADHVWTMEEIVGLLETPPIVHGEKSRNISN